MAQSSNYKQFDRTTRILTEESGFSGGMLWTNNNIDETHLKAIVNFDFDEATGYLTTREPFKAVNTDLPQWFAEQNDDPETAIDFTGYSLIGAYNICPTSVDALTLKRTLHEAGWLYIFAPLQKTLTGFQTQLVVQNPELDDQSDNAVIIFINRVGEVFRCSLDCNIATLTNNKHEQLLTLYDNTLYAFGPSLTPVYTEVSTAPDDWETNYMDYYYYDEAEEQNYFKVSEYVEWANKLYPVYKRTEKTDFIQGYNLEILVESDVEHYTFSQMSSRKVQEKINMITLLEASVTGYNAARGEDVFNYEGHADGTTEILGVQLRDTSDEVIISPRVGQTCEVNVSVSYNSNASGSNQYHTLAVFQLKETNSDGTTTNDAWQFVQALQYTSNDLNTAHGVFTFDWEVKKVNTTLAIVYYGFTTEPSSYEPYASSVKSILAPYTIIANDNLSNVKLRNYDLSFTNSHCLWNNRMCIWGVTNSGNCLFLSEVDNFFYYPIPHNVAVFDTNVISCIPYKDSLLIFTADKIYRMVETKDGTFSQTVVQNAMPMTVEDAPYLTAIKNMVLFKSGNYFYMVVPKTQSLTDELTIAPIYKNIANFLNTLDKSVQEVLQLLYPERAFLSCSVVNQAPTDIYAEQDIIHILYDVEAEASYMQERLVEVEPDVFETQDILTTSRNAFKLFLNYNTNLRSWTLYIEETTDASLEPAALTLSRRMSFIRITPSPGSVTIVMPQYTDNLEDGCRVLIDTGYRTLSTAFNKRFREIQVKLHSTTENITTFGTSFLLDGVWRRSYQKLEEVILDDKSVTLTPVFDANAFISELTLPITENGEVVSPPASDSIELSDWTLDFSHFKREAPTTIRIPVSGKGLNPRFILTNPNAVALTINEINWVYRLMYGR